MTPRLHDTRLLLAARLGRAAQAASKRLGRGNGAVIGGSVARFVCPDILTVAASDVTAVAVSGTNGKTTTTRLIAAALATRSGVLTNDHGANLPNGVVSALLDPHPPGSNLVAEVDERYLPVVMDAVRPRVVVLLNLSRDQIDRMAEVRSNAARWRRSITAASELTVVANCDDPIVAHAVPDGTDAVWVAAGMRWRWDAMSCPACGGRIDYAADGTWACRTCGHSRPQPDVTIEGDRVVLGDESVELDLGLPGEHTRSNAAMALAAVRLLGVEPADAAAAFASVTEVDGRYRSLWGDDRPGRLYLGKNPAGWLEILEVLEQAEPRPLVLVFNANQPDGRDPSWLWDVPVERLRGRTIIVTGERAADMAVRLRYAEVDHAVAPSLPAALAEGRRLGADVLATYTAFWQVKGALNRAEP
ncbi:MAG TPA: MurT ligase domain-containing protein [Acidimicrobiales bacterium]|nr:MurT ligase domain-containing protein [Acidimicrobiales bacterium]